MRYYHHPDPWSLTLAQWNGLMDRIADVNELETGRRDHRAYIERRLRRRGYG